MKIKDLEFRKFISAEKIEEKVRVLAGQINADYHGRIPTFLPILNGSFIFASDLIKEIKIPCRVSFVKISSFQGTQSTGQLKTLIGHEESQFNQDIIIVEDIVDSGLTLQKIMEELRGLGAKSVDNANHKHNEWIVRLLLPPGHLYGSAIEETLQPPADPLA